MSLKAIVSSLEGLPSEVASHYREANGSYVLDIESAGGFALEDVAGLKSSLAKERENVKKLATAAKPYEGLDAMEAREAMQKVGQMANWTPEEKVQEQMAAKEKQLLAKHLAEVEKVKGEYTNMRGQLENHLVKAAAVTAITDNSGDVELLLPHVTNKIKMVGKW